MTGGEAADTPTVSRRGIAALHSTRRWALVVGIVMALYTALAITGYIVQIASAPPATVPPQLQAAFHGTYSGMLALTLLIDGALSWFAFQYARPLGQGLRAKDAALLEAAFRWQRRFWTLQGAITLAFLVLLGFAIIAGVFAAVIHLA